MTPSLIYAASALAITALLCLTAGRAWRGWLEVKRLEIAARSAQADAAPEDIGLRIELAAVRERLKKLEAIAAGVEL
jgi:hypothetical protein